jgi:chitinase
MTTQTYNNRLQWAQSLNFGGTSDWALDLETSYYGNGTLVGTGSGVVYVDPSVLTQSAATIACQPPCTFVLPPWILSTSTVISQPPITETVLELYTSLQTLTNGITSTVYISVTTVTTITLPPVTTKTISVSNVEWTNSLDTIIYFTSSVIFPPIILTESPDVIATGTKTTTLAGLIYTFSPAPYPTPNPSPTTGPPPPPPGPPPPGLAGSVHVTPGPPKPTCIPGSLGCGSLCIIGCGFQLPCIGICGCIGFGCPGGGGCLGPGCGGGDQESSSQTSCSSTYTVTDCQVDCSVTDFGTSTTTTCYSTTCVTVAACSKTGSTTTSQTTSFACPWTTALAAAMWVPTDANALPPVLGGGGAFGYTFISGSNAPHPPSPTNTALANCNFHGQDPDNGVVAQYCVCSGSTFPATANTAYPGSSCAYSTLPSHTTSISTIQQVSTYNCQVCTYAGENAQCSMIPGCTPTISKTVTTTITPTVTQTATVTPTADCAFW